MKMSFRCPYSVTAAAMLLLAGPSAVHSATLTQVPVQNYGDDPSSWMLMPVVSYDAGAGHINVAMPTAVPQLTPLLVSNPADGFDPADPWFDALDPSRRGASFSRRYGFVMNNTSDPLPGGTQMWIRKLSGPPELAFYRYSASAPKLFDPIFGTGGVTNALYWNGMMFHPTVAAPPGTNRYTAVFEVVLRDTATGQDVPNSGSGPLVFEWTNVPDGRPALTISQSIVLAWPSVTTTNWVLESAASVDSGVWTTVTNTPVLVNGQPSVVLEPSAAQRIFRMRYVP
jgi:hypothetical protein